MTMTRSQDRFTDATRNAIALAKQSVVQFRHTHITPEHMLLGLLGDGSPAVLTALKTGKATPEQIRLLVLQHLRPNPSGIPEEMIRFSERAKRVIETAKEEAVRAKVEQIGPEYLLLGLTRVANTVCGAVLRAVDVKTETIRASVVAAK